MSITVEIRGEYIQLDQLLKTTGLCHSGGYAHAEIEAGNVLVDGAVETRKRAKLRPGQHGQLFRRKFVRLHRLIAPVVVSGLPPVPCPENKDATPPPNGTA